MLKILKKMQKEEWLLLALSALLVFGQVFMDLKIPDYMTTITRLVKTEGSLVSDIQKAGVMMILCAVASMILTFCSGFVSAQLAAVFSMHLRSGIYGAVESFSFEEIDRFSTASLITRSTNDINVLQRFVSRGLVMIIRLPITLYLALSKIAGHHWEWTALTAGAVVIVLGAVSYVIRYAHPRFRRMQTLTDDLNRATRENLTGIRVVRAYNAEGYQEDKFDRANDVLTDNAMKAQTAMRVMQPTMKFVNNSLTIGIYCIGAYIISRTLGTGEALTTFSEMVVFSNYASRLLMAFMSLNMIFMQLPRASVCAERINEVLDTEPVIKDGEREEGVPGEEGTVEFRNVSFKYPGTEEVLRGITFTAKKGETVAFIGPTGSGKSTLVNLIPRFYDVSSGQVLVDGRDVKEYRQKALRRLIGYAPQQAVLFTGSVKSNVTYGDADDASAAEDVDALMNRCLDIAQASDFVSDMEGGTDAEIARGGTNVSGGQKQRLSIARAIFRKPEIYIFDDTFSALDYKTDRTLRSRLKEETEGVTTLIVAQRIGTIRDADKIIVLEDGMIKGMGTHDQLMKSCSLYREIAYTQLSKEELE